MRRLLAGCGAVLAVAVLGACSGSSSSGSSAGGVSSEQGAGVASKAAAPGARAAASGTAAASAGAGGAADPGTSGAGADPSVLDDGTTKIRTAQLTVAVAGYQHVAQRADQADDIATQAGGEIDSDDRESGHAATASLRLEVPPDQLQPVLTALGKLGVERSRSSSTTDVTERVADVTSRLGSARESIARLRQLYSGATKVADVIAVESELSSREADLESLEAQQRSLARQTAFATVSLYLVTAAAARVVHAVHHDRGGFLGGLKHGWDGFVAAAIWTSAAVGVLLPFLAVLLVLALAARLVGVRVPAQLRRRGAPAD